MAVDPISGKTLPETTKAGAQSGSTSASNPSAALDKDGFLKLFVAQLQHQDPSNPMQDGDFMGQMAQFSTLEQTTNMAAANQTMATNLGMSQALSLLGKTVTYVDDKDAKHTGVVQKVVTSGGVAQLTVDGVDGIDPSTVAEVSSTSTPSQ
jgi:flagellar basal-body rod modification protein FlgD